MKHPLKLTLLLLALLLPATAAASPITLQQAQQNAMSFLESKGKSISSSSLRQARLRSTSTTTESYYIFNIGSNEGYVIAAGDDCAPAILGYADAGYIDLDSMPVNLQSWLEEYAQQIQFMQENGFPSLKAPKLTSSYSPISPLLTTTWGQRDPYNQNCPDFFGQGKCVTGCVATAMAQIMFYHRANSVTQTTATIPAYTCNSKWDIDGVTQQISVDAIPAGSPIDWDNMLDSYSGSSTTSQQQAVAALMKYCGASVQMNYSNTASGATSENVPIALMAYFNYSNETTLKYRNDYSTNGWDNLIYNELSNSRPVYYSGQSSSSAHAFVCDGFDGSGYYHINWGWDGSFDGYFLLSALNPGQQESGGYNLYQTAVINAQPRSSTPAPSGIGISFADVRVKVLCVQNWDTNGDGELSEEEAAAVTSLNNVFDSNKLITSFDELAFFTGLTSIEDHAFRLCSGLTAITIPPNVTSIGEGAFYNCSGLKSIIIPPNVTSIGKHAFYNCSGLTSFLIPSGVIQINNGTFNGCRGLTSITIPPSVTSIGSEAFCYCTGLTSITIPPSVTSIGNSAFRYCTGLLSITIPSSVRFIGSKAFSSCSVLTSISVDAYNSVYDSRDNCNAIINKSTNQLVVGCKNTIIPSSVTSIGSYAFSGCRGLTAFTIPSNVTSIGDWGFEDCSGLRSISISSNVTSISNHTFHSCSSLTSITIPSGVTSIGDFAFYHCDALTSITLPSNVTSIGSDAFKYCDGLASVTIPQSVTSIGDYAFLGCSYLDDVYSNITDPSRVTMGSSVFSASQSYIPRTLHVPSGSLAAYQADSKWSNYFGSIVEMEMLVSPSIVFDDAIVKAICVEHWDTNGDGELSEVEAAVVSDLGLAFEGSAITSFNELSYFTGIICIGEFAFHACQNLTYITIPPNVTSIDCSAFEMCSALKSISIPSSVTSIGDLAFASCNGLTSIDILGSPIMNGEPFLNCTSLSRVNISSIESWCGIEFQSMYAHPLSYAKHLYLNGEEIIDLVIPDGVTSIRQLAFAYCESINSVTIPPSVKSLYSGAFGGCVGLNSVNLLNLEAWCNMSFPPFLGGPPEDEPLFPRNPIYYADHLYYNGNEVSKLIIPKAITKIPDYAFMGAKTLTSLAIPNTVSSIGMFAFDECDNLADLFCFAPVPPFTGIADYIQFSSFTNYDTAILHVPAESLEAYKTADEWKRFKTIMGDAVEARSISLNQNNIFLSVNDQYTLEAVISPYNAVPNDLFWTSSDTTIVTVSNGHLIAHHEGECDIIATCQYVQAVCHVNVLCDQFIIDDTSVYPGQEVTIPVALENDKNIISFQTDIFLSEGLQIVQENGEYLIEPSDRMTRTHSIISSDVASGAIRVMCYSSNYKPFTGNSGDDLFYITVKVADDAEGIYTIQLKNTLLTASDFVELAAPDVAANVNVKAYLLGDANNSGTVTVTDVVVTSQYVLEMNPQPFVYEAADVNTDGNITVTDVSRIAWMVLNPAMNAPLRAPALWNNGDSMTGEDITLASGETHRVSIQLDNEMDYSAFQFDLSLPEGLTASNYQLTDRASNHAFNVNMLQDGNIRALCYSPALIGINGHEGALLTFDVTATGDVTGDILVDGIELVTTTCQTVKLEAFNIAVNAPSSVNEVANGKTIASVDYFNLAGQQLSEPRTGVNLVVTTYTDGTRTITKLIQK